MKGRLLDFGQSTALPFDLGVKYAFLSPLLLLIQLS